MFLKDPGARLDYRLDWGPRLGGGLSITGSEWRVDPVETDGLTVETSAVDGLETVVWLAGGRVGSLYCATNRIFLSDGSIDERSLTIRVENR
ncbi:MAG: hypothetical protein SNJ63_02155 [Sphingomonadaceae bacterium]